MLDELSDGLVVDCFLEREFYAVACWSVGFCGLWEVSKGDEG